MTSPANSREIALSVVLVIVTSWATSYAEEPHDTRVLDRMLAESDTLATSPPRALQKDLMALPSARKLMARVFVSPKISEHLTRVALDRNRSSRQRVYALFLTHQPQPTWGYDRPGVLQLDEIYTGTQDPLLRMAAWQLLWRWQDLPGNLGQEQERRWKELARENPWYRVQFRVDRSFVVDRELMREILDVLPRRPQIRGSHDSEQFGGTRARNRFALYFRAHAEPDAVGLLLDEYAGSSAARRDLFMWAFKAYAFYGYPERREHADRIARLAREELLRADPESDPEPLLHILRTSNTPEDARTLLEALRNTPPGERRDHIRHEIAAMVEAGKWPKAVLLDRSLFPDGEPKPPKPPAPARTRPQYRDHPRELVRDPYPPLRDPPKEGRQQ